MNKLFIIILALLLIALPMEAITFKITSLGTTPLYTYEHLALTGDDRGVIAVSQSYVYYNGDSYAVRAGLSNLSSPTAVTKNDGFFTNMNGQNLMGFGVNSTDPVTSGPVGGTSWGGPQTITHLLVYGDAGNYVTSIALSSGIVVDTYAANSSANISKNAIFSGFDKTFVLSSGTLYEVNLLNGQVVNHGARSVAYANSESWAASGVAETFGGEDYLTYIASGGTAIMRTRVSDGATSTLASFSNLGDAAAFTVSALHGKWYLHHEVGNQFNSTTGEWLTALSASFEVAVPEPSSMMLLCVSIMFALWKKMQKNG